MKKIAAFIVCAMLCGCHAETNPNKPQSADASESKPVAEAQPVEKQPAAQKAEPLPMDKFEFLYGEKDSAKIQLFEAAANIVKEKIPQSTALNQWSGHIGDWFLIQFDLEKIPPEMIPLDAPARYPDVYLVNLAEKQIIEKLPTGNLEIIKPS